MQQTMPLWEVRQGGSRWTGPAADAQEARQKAAMIGFRNPDSVRLLDRLQEGTQIMRTQLMAAAPMRARAPQDGTMGLGLFDSADQPNML